ncbi:unannotated protein [freshwater metagenome]|uniref:Unannotated protein n=1 Tax=freshwater metagenome TaxID=449393 RepID=A0A6J6E2C8_9ZZZZ
MFDDDAHQWDLCQSPNARGVEWVHSVAGKCPTRQCRHRALATQKWAALSNAEDFPYRHRQNSLRVQKWDRRQTAQCRSRIRSRFHTLLNCRPYRRLYGARCRHSFFSPFGFRGQKVCPRFLYLEKLLFLSGKSFFDYFNMFLGVLVEIFLCTLKIIF